MVKHTQAICLSVFKHFAGLVLKGLRGLREKTYFCNSRRLIWNLPFGIHAGCMIKTLPNINSATTAGFFFHLSKSFCSDQLQMANFLYFSRHHLSIYSFLVVSLFQANAADIYLSKLNKKTLEKCVKYIQNELWRHVSDIIAINGIGLVSLLLTLNIYFFSITIVDFEQANVCSQLEDRNQNSALCVLI